MLSVQIQFVVNAYEPTCIIEHKPIPERPYNQNKVCDIATNLSRLQTL